MSMHTENAQANVRRKRGEAYEALISAATGFADTAINSKFCDNPAEYDWAYVDKKEMLVPYNCGTLPAGIQQAQREPAFPNTGRLRWEKHRVWIVEGILRRGESNLLARRRFYIDEDSWLILLGEGYNDAGIMTMCFMLNTRSIPTKTDKGRWYTIGDQETASTTNSR